MHLVETGKGLLTAAKTAADAQKAVTHATNAAKDAGSKIAASAKSVLFTSLLYGQFTDALAHKLTDSHQLTERSQ